MTFNFIKNVCYVGLKVLSSGVYHKEHVATKPDLGVWIQFACGCKQKAQGTPGIS